MFGLSVEKLLIIALIALFVIGPARLPAAAARLAGFVRTVRRLTDTARERVREEMGPDFDAVDWQRLDPRQYDPRRIIREALLDDPDGSPAVGRAADPESDTPPDPEPGSAAPKNSGQPRAPEAVISPQRRS